MDTIWRYLNNTSRRSTYRNFKSFGRIKINHQIRDNITFSVWSDIKNDKKYSIATAGQQLYWNNPKILTLCMPVGCVWYRNTTFIFDIPNTFFKPRLFPFLDSLIYQFTVTDGKGFQKKLKMVFITYVPAIMKFFAVLPNDHAKGIGLRGFIMFIVRSVPVLFILIPNIAYLIVNFDPSNVFELTDLIYTIVLYDCNWNGYIILVVRQIRFRDLIAELKLMVANSECLLSTKQCLVKMYTQLT